MKTFTDKQINDYKNSGAQICPCCKSQTIAAGESEFDDVSAWRDIVCKSCNEQWTEIFEIVTIEPFEEFQD